MGKLSLELIQCFINILPDDKHKFLNLTLSLEEIIKQYNENCEEKSAAGTFIRYKNREAFHSDFYRSNLTISNNTKLLDLFPGINSTDLSVQNQLASEVHKQLKTIGCTSEEQQTIALFATQQGGLNTVSIIRHILLFTWNILWADQNHENHLYKENNVFHTQQNYYVNSIHDTRNGELTTLESPLIFTTTFSIERIGNNFTYRFETEEILIPLQLKKILKEKIEAEFNSLETGKNFITSEKLVNLAALAEIDEDLRDVIFNFKSKLKKLFESILANPSPGIEHAQLISLIAFARINKELRATLFKSKALLIALVEKVLNEYGGLMSEAQLNSLITFIGTNSDLSTSFNQFKINLAVSYRENLKKLDDQQDLQTFLTLAAHSKLDANLAASLTIYLKKYTGLNYFIKINEVDPLLATSLISDKDYLHKLVFKNEKFNADFLFYLKELAQNSKPNFLLLIKFIIEQYGDLFKFTLAENLIEDIAACNKVVLQEKLTGLALFASADAFLEDSITKHLRKFIDLTDFKKVKAISTNLADKLVADHEYARKLILKNGKINKDLFEYLEILIKSPGTNSRTLLRKILETLAALANESVNLRVSIAQHIQKYTSFNFFKEIYLASPQLALYLFRDKTYRHKLLFQAGKLNEGFFSYLKELAQNPVPNSVSLRFAGNLCREIIQDKKLILKLIEAGKFGENLFTLPTEGLTHLNIATSENIVGEIVKSSEILIDTCLSNTKLRAHFKNKMPTLNTALEQQDKHIGLVTHVLLADRKQHKPNSELSLAIHSEQSARTIIAAAKQDRILSLKLLKNFKLTSTAKTELMLSHLNSKKIAKQLFEKRNWFKRLFSTPPYQNLAFQDLRNCYLNSQQARYYIHQNDALKKRLNLAKIKIKNFYPIHPKFLNTFDAVTLMDLYANNESIRQIIDADARLSEKFLTYFDNELTTRLNCTNEHIAALYLLFPELKNAITYNPYLYSRLLNTIEPDFVCGLLDQDDFRNKLSDGILIKMLSTVVTKRSQIITRLAEKDERIKDLLDSNPELKAKTPPMANKLPEIKEQPVWEKAISEEIKISEVGFKNIFTSICRSGFHQRAVQNTTMEEMEQVYRTRTAFVA